MDFAGLDKLSLLDFDEKISCVVFTKGCNFRCPFCHNSMLVTNLSEDVIKFEDILAYLGKRKGVLDAVVISGGEPTLMNDLKGKIAQIKELGFLVKLDTNGTNPDMVEDLLNNNLLDYVAMDIKNSPSKYDETAGCHVDLDKIRKTMKILESSNIDFEYRTTLVKEFHDDGSILEMAEFVKNGKRIFLQKFVERETCIRHNLHEVEEKKAQDFLKILEPFIETKLRGY